MKKIILFFALCICAVGLHSQEVYMAVGFRGAIGISKLNGMKPYESASILPGSCMITSAPYRSSVYPAWDFGLTIQYGRNSFVVQTDLIVSCLNTGLKDAYVSDDHRIKRITGIYANLAINFGNKWHLNDNYRLIVGLGPYIGVDIYGVASNPNEERLYGKNAGKNRVSANDELGTDEGDYRNFDFGGTILAGIEYHRWQFALNYYHGLQNIVKDDSPLYNRALKASVTYFF
ncbi:hypothetical protein D0T84_13695 [Dysgonomonas sp. 521]|uniref:outer membrane beta-barrel protein n=1 Tax=Dysgonomonas sp. 521 TaxID=2302932 RepID=UPI0013D12A59|nr:outer membrane beta-barrel protein [Dysgonomonas sp. 521]NDV95956.1 hypothetical protein [Dysgonomonas sp. 521]